MLSLTEVLTAIINACWGPSSVPSSGRGNVVFSFTSALMEPTRLQPGRKGLKFKNADLQAEQRRSTSGRSSPEQRSWKRLQLSDICNNGSGFQRRSHQRLLLWIRFPCVGRVTGRSGGPLTGRGPLIELSAVADMRSSPCCCTHCWLKLTFIPEVVNIYFTFFPSHQRGWQPSAPYRPTITDTLKALIFRGDISVGLILVSMLPQCQMSDKSRHLCRVQRT